MCLFGFRPEVRDLEAPVEVVAVVEHDSDWEHDVHAELG